MNIHRQYGLLLLLNVGPSKNVAV